MRLILVGAVTLVFMFLFSVYVFINEAIATELYDDYNITGEVIIDGNIRLLMQDIVENAHEVSIVVHFPHYLQDMKEFVLLIDNNPIQQVMRIQPHRRIEKIGTNIRMESSSPVRAAVLDSSGVWRVVSKKVVVTSPGGCSAPGDGEALNADDIGRILVKQYDRNAGATRIKARVLHPMDTGFVIDTAGNPVPEYYIDRMEFKDNDGTIAVIETYAAMSTNPMVMLDLPEGSQSVRINMRDSKGSLFHD